MGGPRPAEQLTVTVEQDTDDCHEVKLRGELDLATAKTFHDKILEIAGSTVVVDLSELEFIDSSGFGTIKRLRERLEADGHRLVLRGPAPAAVMRVFSILGVSDWISDPG